MKKKNTDPIAADVLNRLILAENELEELTIDLYLTAETLPTKSAEALRATLQGAPLPSDMPQCDADDLRRRFVNRVSFLRGVIERGGARAPR